MKLRDEDKRWLTGEIADQSKKAVDALVNSLRPHGWRKAAFLLRELGPIAAIIGIVVALLGITLSAVYYSVANVKEETKFRTTTEQALNGIRGEITAIRGDLAKISISAHAALPLKEFETTLPDLASTVTTLRLQDLKVSPKVIEDLGHKLASTETNVPGYWPASSALVSYKSQISTTDFANLMQSNLPRCADHDPIPMQITEVKNQPNGQQTMTVSSAFYDNCRFTLDSPEDDAKVNAILLNEAAILTFRHCLILYRGGVINLIVAFHGRPVALIAEGHSPVYARVESPQTIMFENCLFDFQLSKAPTMAGQQLLQTLLVESNIANLKFHSPSTHS
jgi:hypothetical protein